MGVRNGRRGVLAGVVIILISWLAAAAITQAQANDGRRASLVLDANSGRVLHAQSADSPRYPASLTKVMTLYLVFELMEAGKLDANTPIRISAQAAAAPPSKLDLDAGDTIPLGAAIRALVTKSANDIAVAIAEHVSGTEAAFARAMTAKARQLGMRSTTFRNAHGLPDSEQVTTARDMVTLALAIYDHFPRHAQVFATRRFTYAGASYRNHNTMLGNFPGMEGIKTGYTRGSGFNLSASVRRDGRHVVAVVLGGSTAAARNAEMRTLLTRAMTRATTTRSRRPLLLARAEPATRIAETAPQATARRLPRATAAPATQPAPRLVEPIALAAPPRTEPPIVMARVRAVPVVAAPAAAAQPASPKLIAPPTLVRDGPPEPPMYVPPYGPQRAAEANRPWYHAPVAAPARQPQPPSYAEPDTGRGARPSTFAAQAARLDQGQPAVYASRGDAPPYTTASAPPRSQPAESAPISRGDYVVQVGAFATAAEAEERLRAIRQSAASVLAAAADHTEPVQQGARTLYRARFADLEAASATEACNALRRQRVDCFVARLR